MSGNLAERVGLTCSYYRIYSGDHPGGVRYQHSVRHSVFARSFTVFAAGERLVQSSSSPEISYICTNRKRYEIIEYRVAEGMYTVRFMGARGCKGKGSHVAAVIDSATTARLST